MTELEAENENTKKALEDAKKREDEKRDSEKTQVECLLALADVVGRKFLAIFDMLFRLICQSNADPLL